MNLTPFCAKLTQRICIERLAMTEKDEPEKAMEKYHENYDNDLYLAATKEKLIA